MARLGSKWLSSAGSAILSRAVASLPALDLIDGQPEWEVESILKVRRWRNQLQYLVRWKGFSEAHDS